jgi:Holliday junction DNA helicase RuvA
MIAYLQGKLIHKSPNQVVIDTGGVGYCASIPLSTYIQLGEVNGPISLHIHTHLTDSALSLFGFATRAEKDLFLKLISISGIGPKLGLNILSGIGPRELEEAVEKNDIARLALVPGIGKKTALRIALEMQSKLDKKEKVLALKSSPETEDLMSALTNLGFRKREVETVVEAVMKQSPAEAGFEKRLRECLKRLAKM